MTLSPRQQASVLVATMVFFTASALIAAGPASGQAGSVQVDKSASPLSLQEPGGEFTFTVVVTNTSGTTFNIDSLRDDIYGDLATRAGSNCGTLIGVRLSGDGQSATCTFTGTFIGQAGDTQTNIVTVTASTTINNPPFFSFLSVTARDDATVTITPAAGYPLPVGPVVPAAAAPPIALSPAAGAAGPSGSFRLTASMGLAALVAIALATQVAAAVRARRPH